MAYGYELPSGYGNTVGGGDREGGYGYDTSSAYQALQAQQKQLKDQLAALANAHTGFGPFGYQSSSQGILPQGLGAGYGQAANFIMGGSQSAAEQARMGYEAQLRSRTGGAGLGYQQLMQRGGAGLAGQGVSAPLQQLLLRGQSAGILGQMSQGMGADEAAFHEQLAQLLKGTGTELAGLKVNEVGNSLSYLTGKSAADAARPTGISQIAQLLGGVGSLAHLF